MDIETLLQTVSDMLAPWAKNSNRPEPHRLDVDILPEELLEAVQALRKDRWGYLSAITGLDLGPQSNELEALYHFCNDPVIVTLRVRIPYRDAWVPSICPIIPSASLYERELSEMFGITIVDIPNSSKLFLPDDWPSGLYPLRKAFDPAQLADAETPPSNMPGQSITPSPAQKFIVPIGPQHPALKEPGQFEFTVDGEIVTGASVRLGYVHRGLEKAAESQNWTQNLYLFEHTCGICSHIHAYAYCLGVERLAAVEITPRAEAIRELVAGLERIHSHLLWLGIAAHEAGFDTLFMYSWRDREVIMDLMENLTGNRIHHSINVLGGVKFDIGSKEAAAIHQGMEYIEERTRHYLEVVTKDAAFLQRTRGIGIMTTEQAKALNVVGPTARASGVTHDIRIDAPYGSYKRFPISMVTETAGDLEAKFIVRLKEILVSTRTLPTILDNLPQGELTVRFPRRIPAGEVISRVEAPRGELFYFIKSNGGEKPERIKVRTPSMCNFASVLELVIGHQLADVPLILAGIDPCFSCNDR